MSKGKNRQLARQLLAIGPSLMRLVAAQLRNHRSGLVPAQLAVLSTVLVRPYNVTQLAELHGVSTPTMSSMVANLVKKGWLARERSAADRRVVMITLTEAGGVMLQEVSDLLVGTVAELFAELDEAERAQVTAGLDNLVQMFAVEPLYLTENRAKEQENG